MLDQLAKNFICRFSGELYSWIELLHSCSWTLVLGKVEVELLQEHQMDEALEKRLQFLRLTCILGRLNYFRRFNVHMAELLEIEESYLEFKNKSKNKIMNSVTFKKKMKLG